MSVWIDNYWTRMTTSGKCAECDDAFHGLASYASTILTSKGRACRHHWGLRRGIEWTDTLSAHQRQIINRIYHRIIPRQKTWKATQALMRFRYSLEVL